MVLDMSGNVWEWCQSLEKNYPDFANDGRENTDGFGWRIVRGASWKNNHIASQCSNRDAVIPDCYTDDLGFRIAITHKSK
jgi:formylglycine-generating enzyme required for sulfatase activity